MFLPTHAFNGPLLMLLMTIATRLTPGQAIVNNITIDYAKVGACNSSIVARVGDFCDYVVTIIIPATGGSSNASTDLSVEIIMPDNDTMVMQMSKPQITYVGGNFLNPSTLYDPTITMTSQLNTSQFDDARIDFGTVVNSGLSSPANTTQNSIMISFRSVVISNPSYQTNGSQYWVTVGIEYNNVSEIWIGQALFIFSNFSGAGNGPLALGSISNSSLQIPQGSPFQLQIPVIYNSTFASNFMFTITNNNPTQLGLCSAYVQSASNGFWHLPTLGNEISTSLTSALLNNQISISLGQIVNTQFYSGPSATLTIVVYGRVFKRDGISTYVAGTMTAQVNATGSAGASQIFTIYGLPSVIPSPMNGSLPTFSITPLTSPVGIYQTLRMRVTMTVPIGFSAPVVIDLNGSSNTSIPILRACNVIFQSAGENVGSSNPQCTDANVARRTFASTNNGSDYDQVTYDYGVISSFGSRPSTYADGVDDIVFDAIFQLLNTSQSLVWPAVAMTIGNNTLWLGNAAVNVTTMNYNATNATRPTFQLTYENNGTANQSSVNLGETRLFYYDIYTKPNSIYTPMSLRITTNETIPGNSIPALSICAVRILYVGTNIPCLFSTFYNQPQSPYITYSSRYNQRKNDTVTVQFGPLCNYATTQSNDDIGRIRLGVYVKAEAALGSGQTSYVNLDVFYAPLSLWVGQISFTGQNPGTTPNVIGTPLLFALNTTTQSFFRDSLTVVNYGLKIPPSSRGTYSGLTSVITEANQQTSVCRVDVSPSRGMNVPCSNDVSSAFTFNSNGVSSSATTNLGMICSIGTNSSTVNSSLSLDSDTLIIQVFLLATSQTASSFSLSLSNLVPSGQSALGLVTSSFTGGVAGSFGNVSTLNILNATVYQQTNDTNNASLAYLGQDVAIRIQFVVASNFTGQACYPLIFRFGITAATNDAAYMTNAFVISTGDNLMCMKSKAKPIFGSGGSTVYNASMFLDLGTLCYYPLDPMNTTASTLIVQANARLPVTTTVAINSIFSVNIATLLNQNQSLINTSVPFTVTNQTLNNAFVLFPNDSASVAVADANSTVSSAIRQTVTYNFRVSIPLYAQGRLQIWITAPPQSGSVTINLLTADILSAGINVGSFMFEYALGNRYQWTYSTTVVGSSYQNTAYLDLGVVTNTGSSFMQGNSSNTSDNSISFRATAYLTDSPLAENNYPFALTSTVFFGLNNFSTSYSHIVTRNGTEKPVMIFNHTDLTSGPYGLGSTYRGQVIYSHDNSSNAECVNAQIIMYLPGWITLQSYNASSSVTNYTTDSSSYVLFNLGTLLFNDVGSITFTLNVGTSNQMSLVYARYYSPKITIPLELMCRKRPRNNTAFFSNSKIFAFADTISLSSAISPMSSNYPSILNNLQACQFTTSVPGSDASLVRTTGWQTGYRSNQWMLAGGTYLQINFGNLTLIDGIYLSVPVAFAPIRTIQFGFSWDGISFAMDSVTYPINGSSTYSIPLAKPWTVGYLRIYILDVMQPTDLLTKTSGFILNITGTMNSSNVTVANVCPSVSSSLAPRRILVAPATAHTGLTYVSDVYVCDETPSRSSIQCFVLHNGDVSSSAIWTVLNSTVANIILFTFDQVEQIQSLYGYAQDGVSMLRSDDRGVTWVVTTPSEYANMTSECAMSTKICTTSDVYSIMTVPSGRVQLQSGSISWSVSVRGVWTDPTTGVLSFDWFGY